MAYHVAVGTERGAKEKENSEWVRHCLQFNDKNIGTGRSGLVWSGPHTRVRRSIEYIMWRCSKRTCKHVALAVVSN